jgi:hypothetical protein
MLTNSELVLGAAGIGVLGTVLGTVLSWLTGGATARRQWRREERRRQADRRIALYEEMLAEVETRSREQVALRDVIRSDGAVSPPLTRERDADREARFNARVMLFASLKVNGLWHNWLDPFAESWFSMEDSEYADWQQRTGAAAQALATTMRTELDSQ